MLALRWILGSVLVFGAGGFVFLCIVAGGFRRSFGASAISPFITIGPLVAAGILFATLLVPTNRPLLHAGAVAAGLLVGFSIWQIVSESATVTWFALIYLALWFVFYANTLKTPALASA